jgi:hypothetical protein
MPVRFLISTLKLGVDPAEYERWVRERDCPPVRSKPNHLSYTLHRLRGPIGGMAEAGWHYIERIEVESLDQHRPRSRRARGRRPARGAVRPFPRPLAEHYVHRRRDRMI